MKTPKIEEKTSSNYQPSSSSFKKIRHYFDPDNNFEVDHSWGKGRLNDENKKTKK